MPRYTAAVVPAAIASRFVTDTVQPDERCNCDSCGNPLDTGDAVHVDRNAETVHCSNCIHELNRHVQRGGQLQPEGSAS